MAEDPLPPLDSDDELRMEESSARGFALGALRRFAWTAGILILCAMGWYLFKN